MSFRRAFFWVETNWAMGFVLPPSKLYVHALFLDELTDLINAEGRVNREGGEGSSG